MGSVLKKIFIPHEGNDHKPHILRWATVRVILLLMIFLEMGFLIQVGFIYNKVSYLADIVESVLAADTNQNRTADSLQALTINPLLQQAAQMKANDMAAKGYFSHISPDGSTPWDWMQSVGYVYSYAGENLAVNFVDSSDVVNAWMASPEHRANILDSNFTEMGYGIAQGKYEGKTATFVVQMFGAPPETAAVAVAPASPKPAAPSPAASKPETVANSLAINRSAATTSQQTVATTQSPSVLGETSTTTAAPQTGTAPSQAGIFSRIVSSPLATTSYVFGAISLLFLIALVLKITIRNHVQHISLIMNGALMIFVVNCLLLLNRYIALSQLKIL